MADAHLLADRPPPAVERHPPPDRAALTAYLYALHAGDDPRERLRRGLAQLPGLVAGCHHASATTGCGVQGSSVGTDDTARRGDELQQLVEDGPTLHALRTGHSVLSHDLRREPRWPRWCDRASRELRLGAALAILLHTEDRPLGTLNLYSDASGGLSDTPIGLLHALAVPLGTLLVEARLEGQQLGPAPHASLPV